MSFRRHSFECLASRPPFRISGLPDRIPRATTCRCERVGASMGGRAVDWVWVWGWGRGEDWGWDLGYGLGRTVFRGTQAVGMRDTWGRASGRDSKITKITPNGTVSWRRTRPGVTSKRPTTLPATEEGVGQVRQRSSEWTGLKRAWLQFTTERDVSGKRRAPFRHPAIPLTLTFGASVSTLGLR